jgi:hypothetical protein
LRLTVTPLPSARAEGLKPTKEMKNVTRLYDEEKGLTVAAQKEYYGLASESETK